MKRQIRNFRDFFFFLIKTKKSTNGQDNHFEKRARIRGIQKKYNFSSFIETGTFFGQMSVFAAKHFEIVHTIESYLPIYSYNHKRIQIKNIKKYYGKSVDHLESILEEEEDNCLFWLDGHWSGPGTGGKNEPCPVLEEINIIQKKKLSRFCILIDDARCFNGESNYPKLELVIKTLNQIGKISSIEKDSDCVIALKV